MSKEKPELGIIEEYVTTRAQLDAYLVMQRELGEDCRLYDMSEDPRYVTKERIYDNSRTDKRS